MPEKILIVEDEFIVAKHLESILESAGYDVCGIAISVAKALEIIEMEAPELVLLDIYLKGDQTGIDLAYVLNEKGIAFVYLSANSNQSVLEEAKATRPYGFMVKPFREDQVLIALDIARYQHRNSLESSRRKEAVVTEQLSLIEDSVTNYKQAFLSVVTTLQPHIPFDYIEMGRYSTSTTNSTQWCSFLRKGFSEYQTICARELLEIANITGAELDSIRKNTPNDVRSTFYDAENFKKLTQTHPLKKLYARAFGVRSVLVLPLLVDYALPFVLYFYSKSPNAYQQHGLQFLGKIQQPLTSAIARIVADTDFREERAEEQRLFKVDDLYAGNLNNIFPGIIGRSQPLLAVLDYVQQVAGADTSVLILGETGTGKEKIARHIHELSPRKNKPLVKVNCAALPLSLIESELFGHEKGAFTGAVGKRTGRFEQANGGTLFLDEIGDVPLDVQIKLLRVLQEKEIERVGGNETVRVDVRIIAATNKNLEKEIAEGRFRMDFYYRLNVFPVLMPPLRKRLEDIPLLVNHFIRLYSEKYHKSVAGITGEAMDQLMKYEWPGNIRELENSIERSVVLAKDHDMDKVFIQVPQSTRPLEKERGGVKSIEEVEREHIQIVLEKCNYKIYGPGGAAQLLNLPPTTLTSKMKKLGISKNWQSTQ